MKTTVAHRAQLALVMHLPLSRARLENASALRLYWCIGALDTGAPETVLLLLVIWIRATLRLCFAGEPDPGDD